MDYDPRLKSHESRNAATASSTKDFTPKDSSDCENPECLLTGGIFTRSQMSIDGQFCHQHTTCGEHLLWSSSPHPLTHSFFEGCWRTQEAYIMISQVKKTDSELTFFGINIVFNVCFFV